MSDALLTVSGLRTHFFTRAGVVKAVDDVSFSVARGEALGLVGESGSGKSVTAYSVLGLVDPPGRIVAGSVALDGRELLQLPVEELRRTRGNRMAMILPAATLALDPVLRIDAQMVEAILAHERVSRAAALQRAREALARVGVRSPSEHLRAYAHQLSAGMRQRVAIAIALLNQPDVIIADEPTAALDATVQGQILFEMQKLQRETGAGLIWISHDLAVIAGLADRICVMYAGRIVEQGTTAEILQAPGHPYTRGLLDSIPANVPPRERLRQISGLPPSPLDLPTGCPFRPRCPRATVECEQPPESLPFGLSGRTLRCFHPLSAPE
jgi:peptide/nickel transport system ATP-binding protein